jgi:GldM N-terminal domain
MKWGLFILTLPLVAFLAGCHTATNKTLEEFKKVDSSLKKTNITIGATYSTLYKQIQAKKGNNLQLAIQADTLFRATEDAHRFIEDLIQKLNESDSSGIQLDVGTRVITNTTNSAVLTKRLNLVYASCIRVLSDKQQITQAENTFSVEQEIKTNKNWTAKYFAETPTNAVVTILTKFKNDCSNLATFSLTEIEANLVE